MCNWVPEIPENSRKPITDSISSVQERKLAWLLFFIKINSAFECKTSKYWKWQIQIPTWDKSCVKSWLTHCYQYQIWSTLCYIHCIHYINILRPEISKNKIKWPMDPMHAGFFQKFNYKWSLLCPNDLMAVQKKLLRAFRFLIHLRIRLHYPFWSSKRKQFFTNLAFILQLKIVWVQIKPTTLAKNIAGC